MITDATKWRWRENAYISIGYLFFAAGSSQKQRRQQRGTPPGWVGMGGLAGHAVNPAPRPGPTAGGCAFERMRGSASQAMRSHPWGLDMRHPWRITVPPTHPRPPSDSVSACMEQLQSAGSALSLRCPAIRRRTLSGRALPCPAGTVGRQGWRPSSPQGRVYGASRLGMAALAQHGAANSQMQPGQQCLEPARGRQYTKRRRPPFGGLRS